MSLLREGNPIAFHRIYNRHCKRLYSFVLRYVKQEEDTEGIVQEVFLKLWESRSKIDIYASFEAFLFTVAYNQTIIPINLHCIWETKDKNGQQELTTSLTLATNRLPS